MILQPSLSARLCCLLPALISQLPLSSAAPHRDVSLSGDVDSQATILVRRKDWLSPEYTLLYRHPLPIPPVKQPKKIIKNPVTGKDIWYYELEIKEFQQQVYPTLRPAKLVGYDGMSPGPTFVVPVGTETVVRVLNSAKEETSVHLHGSPSRAPFDAGAYLLLDPAEDALGLPTGYGQYDIPLVLSSKVYNEDGTLQSTKGEDDSLWGDIIHVNGQPWPFFNVEPRKYRLRFLNAAVSRDWDVYFVRTAAANSRIPFQVIASDAGLLEKPISVTDLYISVGERWEIVIDFTAFAGQTLDLRSVPEANGIGKADEYEKTLEVMRFVVKTGAVTDPSTKRHFLFHHSNSQYLINDVGFADIENRVLARPPVGTVETWELENNSGGWTHPVHLHLVDFRVIKRTGGRGVMAYEAAGLKDVVWLGRGETVTVEAHYLPWTGVYMMHCHNLIHEDHDMMAVFNVTALTNMGYDETTDFSDPMDPRWRAVPFNRADFTARTGPFADSAITDKVQQLAQEEPYSQLDEALEALDS
ncbi:Cupredoxin [Paramyrothecium foliicola]|nr:Cupredoxin [Paramyrothecium foliicola]